MKRLKVGDEIEFERHDGIRLVRYRGKIQTVGKHGYWIDHNVGCYGTGSIRCPFNSAKLIKRKGVIILAKKEKHVSHRRATGATSNTKTACGLNTYEVKGAVKDTWAGVKCGRCLKVKEAEAKAKAAKKAARKAGKK